jgi:uncharacterized membrane protein YagU involved in acid resistance
MQPPHKLPLSELTSTDLVAGCLAGLGATIPMTAVMLVLHYLLPQRRKVPLEPLQVSQKLLAAGDVEPVTQEGANAVAAIAHLSFGATCGMVRPPLRQIVGRRATRGPYYGLMIYAASYAGWLPMLGILRPPQRRPWQRNVILLASHLTWGIALDLIEKQLTQPHR